MKKTIKLLKRYRIFLGLLVVNIVIALIFPDTGKKSLQLTASSLFEMIAVVPPIFVLLGLMDIWVKKETMIRYMGENSGLVGILIAYFLGAAAAGPLYAAFPVAGVLLKKGSRISNVLIFIGAWSTMKIPLLLFESASLGLKFTLIRLAVNIVGVFLIAEVIGRVLNEGDKEKIRLLASGMTRQEKAS